MNARNSFTLLYNQLWLADANKINQLNPDYIIPEELQLKNILKSEFIIPEPRQLSKVPNSYITNSLKESKPVAVQPSAVSSSAASLISDWDELVDKVNNCTLCSLCDGRKNVVFERGSRKAEWMFVGEGPGEEEDAQGYPFVGKSGQLLDKMILAMKLDKDHDVYVCNVVKCRPPYNRNPEIDEITACKNYLLSQIELVKPKKIIALGRFASQTLLDSNLAIGKLRNKVHCFKEIPLIVTYHPAYLLRNPGAKKDAWNDLKLAMQVNS